MDFQEIKLLLKAGVNIASLKRAKKKFAPLSQVLRAIVEDSTSQRKNYKEIKKKLKTYFPLFRISKKKMSKALKYIKKQKKLATPPTPPFSTFSYEELRHPKGDFSEEKITTMEIGIAPLDEQPQQHPCLIVECPLKQHYLIAKMWEDYLGERELESKEEKEDWQIQKEERQKLLEKKLEESLEPITRFSSRETYRLIDEKEKLKRWIEVKEKFLKILDRAENFGLSEGKRFYLEGLLEKIEKNLEKLTLEDIYDELKKIHRKLPPNIRLRKFALFKELRKLSSPKKIN